MTNAVVLLSGGLDSGTAMALWLAVPGHRVELAITLDYGQRGVAEERQAAERLARRFGVPWREVAVPWLEDAARRADCALVSEETELPVVLPRPAEEDLGDRETAAAVWVPARNVVFLSVAAAFAEASGAGVVIAGFNREEAATFPDNSAEFVAAFGRVLQFGTRTGVEVQSPTVAMDKTEIAAAAKAHGLRRSDFWSCYASGPEPCEKCESCARSRRAWASWGEG